MNKVSVIMARGVEGCGVTKYTVEQIKWLRKHGHDVKVYAAKDKNYSRKYAHDLGEFEYFKFAEDQGINKMIEECNNSDVIIINSLPSKDTGRGKGSGEDAVKNWKRALKSFKKPVALIQHDHTVYSIKRNGALEEAIDAAKIIFVHSTENDFSDYVKVHTGIDNPLLAAFGEVRDFPRIISFQPGIDFDGTRARYWKPIEEQDDRHHKWIGRCTSWKGYNLMFDWHNKFLAPNGYLTTFEGIEKSPAYLAFKEISDFYSELQSHPKDVDLSSRYGDKATVFSTFVNDELMHRMSRVGFGYQLSVLKQKYIERSIEYTHQEVVAAGAIPVFRKEYGDACKHRVTGDPLSQSKDNYTLWLSDTNGAEVIEQVKKLVSDSVLRDEWREGAFEFYKQHQDSELTFADLMNKIKENV
jgi:hypothetical protein